jgi:AraC family transcriptional regulator, arabinose operon regulatory protein
MPPAAALMDILTTVRTMVTLHKLLSHHESGHYRAMPPFVTTRRRPTDHLIIWLVRGELDATIGRVDLKAGPGDLLVLEPQVPQRYEPNHDGDWEWLWVHYGGTAARDLSGRIRGRSGPVVRFGFDEHVRARFLELVATAASQPAGNPTGHSPAPDSPARHSPAPDSPACGNPAPDSPARGNPAPDSPARGNPARGNPAPDNSAGDSLRLDSCLYSLLGLVADRASRLAAGRARSGGNLHGIHELINERLAEPLTLRDLVTFTGYSATHLNRLFRDQTGESPMHYVHRLRMARAASLLTISTMSVGEIARAVGFPDPYHFSRRFKQSTGYAPAHYRAANQRAAA